MKMANNIIKKSFIFFAFAAAMQANSKYKKKMDKNAKRKKMDINASIDPVKKKITKIAGIICLNVVIA